MRKRFDELFREIVTILRRDYAGYDRLEGRFEPRYYNQAIGQAWHDDKLDPLLFLRYVSQMLACTGDRRLRLSLRSGRDYSPWGPGFYTRRYEDSLYVTAVTEDSRFAVGDYITSVNGGSISKQRTLTQMNFFYAEEPEREDWHGMLKMADFVDVVHTSGEEERLELEKHSPKGPAIVPAWEELEDGIVYIRPGHFDGSGSLTSLLTETLVSVLASCRGLILDLRNTAGEAEEDFYPLLPYLCRQDTPLADLLSPALYVNYSRLNCLVLAAGLQGSPEGEEEIQGLAEKAGLGFVLETEDNEEEIIPGRAPEKVVVLTDTWTRDGGETLAMAAKKAGAVLLGRPTLGTIGYCGDVHYELDDLFVLTWPTAVVREERDKAEIQGKGIAPDIFIPWSPRELTEDMLPAAAVESIQGNAI